MKATLTIANQMNLVAMTPQNALSSTAYCLANAGKEYLVYAPSGGTFTVNLSTDPLERNHVGIPYKIGFNIARRDKIHN